MIEKPHLQLERGCRGVTAISESGCETAQKWALPPGSSGRAGALKPPADAADTDSGTYSNERKRRPMRRRKRPFRTTTRAALATAMLAVPALVPATSAASARCAPPRGPGDHLVHSGDVRARNIDCRRARLVIIGCAPFSFGHSGTCRAVGYRWFCTSRRPSTGTMSPSRASPAEGPSAGSGWTDAAAAVPRHARSAVRRRPTRRTARCATTAMARGRDQQS